MTFGDMVIGAFGIKADTKKSDIGKYFTDIESTMTTVKKKLQDEVAKNGNYVKVKTVVDKFITDTLDKIVAGVKEAAKGATGSDVIGNAVKNEDAIQSIVASKESDAVLGANATSDTSAISFAKGGNAAPPSRCRCNKGSSSSRGDSITFID
ncbi:Variable outer membrane protein (plasmid) [Borrelia nietonii YOR]|uniref:Variable large protein n=1 Tax=Borrelia nietonii YOR TaxID=1293576 RepID=W5SG93_9SPIR|nr:Variable outer membrane protein [Borrelia nietonii YOR]